MGRIGKLRLAGLLVEVTLLVGACVHRNDTGQVSATSAASLAPPTTATLDKLCLHDLGSARPFGDSRAGTGPDARIDADVVAAAEQLRRRGADRIVLVGSSMGATAVLVAATRIHPPVAGVVSLSGRRPSGR